MKVLISEKLSAHKVKTPEGYLICSDAILARTGKQTYTRDELFHDGDNSEVEVDRTPEEVFSEETLASFENKPLTITHPDEDVTPDNHKELGVGFVRDVRRATRDGQEVMVANIVVTDAEAIEAIESGELLELSCGYDCDISDDEHPCQRNIRGNHVALCKQGRAGNARIVDSINDEKLPSDIKNELNRIFRAKSTFIKNRDYDVSEFVREIERWFRIDGKKISLIREKIYGWNKMGDGMMRKDYVFTVDGYSDRFMISIYAKPDTYETTELNAYFLDSINDEKYTSADAESELPEEEDSEFRYYDAYGQEIHVVNWDGKNQFMVIHKGKEMMMNRQDTERYLDRQGARFSKVIRDSVKDAAFEICYINNGDIRIMIQAKSEEDARKKFWNQYGAYSIKSIKKIKDSDTQEEVTKGMKKNLKNFKDAKYRVGQTVMYGGKRTVIVKIEHDDKYGYDLLIKNPNWDGNNPKLENIWVGENVKTIDCKDISDCDYLNTEESVKDAIQPSHDDMREQIVYVMQSNVDKNLYFYIGKTHAMKEGEFTYQQYKMNGMSPDELKKELEAAGWHKVDRGPAPFIDSVKDAMQKFEIVWTDTYTRSKGYPKDMWRFVSEIKANSLKEALQKLANKVALGGIGTANAFVDRIHSDKASYQYSGKLSELLRKNLGDSKKEFIVKVNGKKYRTMAKDSFGAVQNIEKVLAATKSN